MPRPNSGDSARRLISLLGQLTPGVSVRVADLAATLGTTRAQLADDLETLCVCGVAPYMPDQMLDVFVEDGMLEVYSPLPAVAAPVRLSPGEARALASALAAAGFTAEDPLVARLLSAASAQFDAEQLERSLRSAIATHEGATFETLAAAIAAHEAVEIGYQSDGASAPTARTVEPMRLLAERGAWYLSAWCRNADGMRTFRVDRIREAHTTGELFDPSAHAGAAAAEMTAFAPEGLPVAQLRFSAGEPFVEREWPGGRVVAEEPDGSVIAEVPFAGTTWLARRVVARLGRVVALAPVEIRSAVVALACEELGSASS